MIMGNLYVWPNVGVFVKKLNISKWYRAVSLPAELLCVFVMRTAAAVAGNNDDAMC